MARPATKEFDAALLADAGNVLRLLLGDENVREGSGDEIDLINIGRGDQAFGSFKFNSKTGMWSDFAQEEMAGKGIIALVAKLDGCGVAEAMKRLKEEYLAGWNPDAVPEKPKKKIPSKALADLKIEPVHDAEILDGRPELHPDLGIPSAVYDYKTNDGDLAFCVYRFDLGDGKKETRPLSFSTEKNQWVWKYPPPPWPLYKVGTVPGKKSLLTASTGSNPIGIIVNEGEKAANASAAAYPNHMSVTSASGSGNAFKSDWSLLRDAPSVMVIPDADEPGAEYGLTAASLAFAHGVEDIRVVNPAEMGWKEGDDIADHPDTSLEQLEAAAIRYGIEAGEPNAVRQGLGRGRLASLAAPIGVG